MTENQLNNLIELQKKWDNAQSAYRRAAARAKDIRSAHYCGKVDLVSFCDEAVEAMLSIDIAKIVADEAEAKQAYMNALARYEDAGPKG